jgi:tryptophan synthase beta chain
LPALESSHAIAAAMKQARQLGPGKRIVVCLSGRGDKDSNEIARIKKEMAAAAATNL